MTRRYQFNELIRMLNSKTWFVIKGHGEQYSFAKIVD